MPTESETPPRRRWKRWLIAGIVVAVIAAVVTPAAMVLAAWARIDRVDLDTAAARQELALVEDTEPAGPSGPSSTVPIVQTMPTIDIEIETPVTVPPSTTSSTTTTTTEPYPPPPPVPQSAPVPDSAHQAILIIGSDRTIGGSRRADVLMLALLPSNGANPMLVSIPRDLYLDNPCGGGRQRVNAALNGCGSVSGPNLLAVVVEDFTGIPIDHFVLFDYDGFADVIDVAGGIEVCVPYPTFDTNTTPDLDLPAGCSTLEGRMALAWVRSRKTRQIVDGVEQAVPGVGDLTRNARQRDVVRQMLSKLSGFSNPAEVVALANAAPGAFTLDSGLSIGSAVSIAWDLRGRTGSIRSPGIRVSGYVTSTGAYVLLPTQPFSETIG